MQRWIQGLTSSIGLKFVMAVTGTFLFLFVIAHLVGNLQLFAGPDAINGYAEKLQSLGPLLWVMRLGLLGIFVLHIAAAARLTRLNRAARPIGYVVNKPVASTESSRTMLATGFVVLLFVVYHLLHFTIGVGIRSDLHGLTDPTGRTDVYTMVVEGFRQLPIAMFYVLAMVGLGMHLSHGIASAFQSVGWLGPRYRPFVICGGQALAWVIVAGNIAMPLAAMLGVLELPAWYPPEGGPR